VVRQAFYAGDRHLKAGDPFDPRAADCEPYRVQQLWSARYIDCNPAPVAKSEPAPPAEKAEQPKKQSAAKG